MTKMTEKILMVCAVVTMVAMAVILVAFSYGLVRQAILYPDELVIMKGCK